MRLAPSLLTLLPRSIQTSLLVLLLAAPAARAQEAVLETTLPDSIVVTASRQPEDARRTGRRIAVWTARDLEQLPVASFDELLRAVGGIEVHSRGGFGVQSDLTMRGSSFNGVLVLLDGARLNDPMTGHFLADFPVPLAEIARVEVLRGPAAALYGPDALGGVIQIFTYTGLRRAGGTAPGLEGSAVAQRGAFDLTHLDAGARWTVPSTSLSGATSWMRSDGMPVEDAAGTPVVGSDGTVRTDFRRQAHTVALFRDFGGAELFTRAGFDDRDFGAYHFYTAFPSDTAREATRTYWTQARLQGGDPAGEGWRLQLAARQHEDVYVYNPQTPANDHTSRLATLQADHHRPFGPDVDATIGASAALRAIDSNNLGRHDDASAGAFATARWRAARRLTVNGSARLDYDPAYGVEPTPQLSLAYNRAAVTVRAAVGRAVRAPNYIERYFNTTLARPRGRSLGSPDLKPERAWSYEAGADLFPTPGLSVHATVFLRRTDDLIDYVRLSPADTVWLARNLLDVETRGLELDAAWSAALGGGRRMRLEASYTRLGADLGGVEEGVEYKYVLTHARHLLQGIATVDVGAVRLGLQGLWKDRLAGSSYGVVDARAAYRPPLWQERLLLTAEVRNLFDVQYAEVFDAPMPGRWLLVGLRLGR